MRITDLLNGRLAAFPCLRWLSALSAANAPVDRPPAPIFVLNSLDASVSVIDPLKWDETQRIATGKEPHHLYLTPDEKSVIVANSAGDSLTFLDPRPAQVQRVVYGIIDPYQLQFSRDMKWFVTAGNRLNHVDVYRWDGKDLKLVKRIASGKTPSHIYIDARSIDGTTSGPMQDSDELIAVDLATQTVRWRMPTGAMPADIYGVHGDKALLVGLTGGDGVQIVDVSGPVPKITGKILTGKGAHAFRAMGDGKSVLVSNRVANTISRIDVNTLQVIDNYPGAGWPGLHGRVGRWQDPLRHLALGQEAQRGRPRRSHGGATDQCWPLAPRRLDPGPCGALTGSWASPPSLLSDGGLPVVHQRKPRLATSRCT